MDLKELVDLITVRNYVVSVINNSAFDRSIVNDLSGMTLLLDKKIVATLRTSEFKEYINFQDVKKVVSENIKLNDIKSGLVGNR